MWCAGSTCVSVMYSYVCIIYRMDAVVAFGLVYWFGLMVYVWVCVGALYCRFVYFLSHVHFVQTNEKHVIVKCVFVL